jgi:hypothetical protein
LRLERFFFVKTSLFKQRRDTLAYFRYAHNNNNLLLVTKQQDKNNKQYNKIQQLINLNIIMKLSSTSLLFALALLSANNNNFVRGECQATDTNCSGEYKVPDAPSVCKGNEKTTDSCKVPCTINGISYVCTKGSFVQGGVGAAFTDPPAAAPAAGCDGTPEDCSGTAVIMDISKDAEETTDIDSLELDDSAASATIVSSIIGFTAIAGVVALL